MSYRDPNRIVWRLVLMLLFAPLVYGQVWSGDTLTIHPINFEVPSPQGWNAQYETRVEFPGEEISWSKILMIQTLKCDSATAGDSYPCGEWDYIWNTLLEVPQSDSTEVFSLGSFVTPYGKRLNLGGDAGWVWRYDITEYAPLLIGQRNVITGNNQELLDLKFQFIKGQPARKVLSVQNIYPYGTYQYEHLASDSVLKEQKVVLAQHAAGFQLKAVISGHDHAGPRNCCEWDSKTHSYYLNKWETFRWNVWKDCGNNPIYPQGGTWPFDRAGWCPGTKVDEYTFEITPKVNPGDTILIDYGIENFQDNGEKAGHFRMSHQLFSYGPPNFNYDAEILEILEPSSHKAYSRYNPSCGSPRVLIRNNGQFPMTSLIIVYGLKGQRKTHFTWSGNLEFLETEVVDLPALPWKKMRKQGTFMVELKHPGTVRDENLMNNKLSSQYELPLVFPDEFILNIATNTLGRASENAYTILDGDGLAWYHKDDFQDSTQYRIPIALEKGCYEFVFTDEQEDGISLHWWYRNSAPELVGINGSVQFESLDGDTLAKFPPDFGQELRLSFMVK